MRKTWLALALTILAGCASLPAARQKTSKRSPQRSRRTPTLGRIVAASEEGKGRNLSGIRLLSSGDEALDSLIALADHAERTLDIQYYIIRQDESARALLQHVRSAADRGVRVRLLVDDLNTSGEDRRFMHLGQHPNVEVRVFNPFPGGRSAIWSRILTSISDIPRINHRMHNKLFVADNALAITGGRNIGDEYFTLDKHSNFIDLDVVGAGPIVPQLSASFDAFWNSKYAYPIASLAGPAPAAPAEPPQVRGALGAGDVASAGCRRARMPIGSPRARCASAQAHWVPATVLADRPAKIASDVSPDQEETIANNIATLMRSAQQEILVISPYFVPGKEGLALMRELIARGVHIRIITNSLASTDAPLVHNGYAHYRVALLKMGVELSEVRPRLGQKRAPFPPVSQRQREPACESAGHRSTHRVHRLAQHGRALETLQFRARPRDAKSGDRAPGDRPHRRHQRRRQLPSDAGCVGSHRVVERGGYGGEGLASRARNDGNAAAQHQAAGPVCARGAALAERLYEGVRRIVPR